MEKEYTVKSFYKRFRTPYEKYALYRNKKTGAVYKIISDYVINTTNKDDGTDMVLYEDWMGRTFVREKTEFYEKFIPKEGI